MTDSRFGQPVETIKATPPAPYGLVGKSLAALLKGVRK